MSRPRGMRAVLIDGMPLMTGPGCTAVPPRNWGCRTEILQLIQCNPQYFRIFGEVLHLHNRVVIAVEGNFVESAEAEHDGWNGFLDCGQRICIDSGIDDHSGREGDRVDAESFDGLLDVIFKYGKVVRPHPCDQPIALSFDTEWYNDQIHARPDLKFLGQERRDRQQQKESFSDRFHTAHSSLYGYEHRDPGSVAEF